MAKKQLSRPEVFDAVLEAVETSGVIPRRRPVPGTGRQWVELTKEEQIAALKNSQPRSEYTAFKKLVKASVIDSIYMALEDVYADFPDPEQAYAEANSIPADWEGIHTIKGEEQYLNWVISGLLSLMSEAAEKGHGRNATRFAFEAGILWSMNNHAKVRRTASTNKATLAEAQRLAKLARTKEEKRIAKLIRKEVATILRGSPVPMKSTSARKVLAGKSHFTDGSPMVCLRTINEAFGDKSKRKAENR